MTRKRTSENDLSITAGGSVAPARRKTTSRTRKHVVAPDTPTTPAAAEPEIAVPNAVAEPPIYQPSREEVAAQAYLYWEARGCQGGSPEEDWLRAEEELRLRSRANSATA